MTVTTRDRELVDREFRPGELPPAEPSPLVVQPAPRLAGGRRPSRAAWLALGAAGALLAFGALGSAVNLVQSALRDGNLLDGLSAVAIAVWLGALGWLGVQQARALRRLKSAERAQALADQLLKLDGAGSGLQLLAALRAVYGGRPDILARLEVVERALQPHHSDRDVVALLNREIFDAMDGEADQRIQKAALRAGFGVSSVPHPALDALVVVGLSLLLVRDLMGIYGLRHSWRGLLRVLTRALFLASGTAVMSTAVEFAARAAQDRLAAALVGTAGEALVVARRMFALGALAKAEIRPLPKT